MGIFDKLKSSAIDTVMSAAGSIGNRAETFTFAARPAAPERAGHLFPQRPLPRRKGLPALHLLCGRGSRKQLYALPALYRQGREQPCLRRRAGLYEALHPLRRRGCPAPHQAPPAGQRREVVPVGAVPAHRRPHPQGRRPVGVAARGNRTSNGFGEGYVRI